MGRSTIAACAGFVVLLGPASVQAASLIDDLQYLIETNPRVQAAQNNLRAAGAGIDEAFGDYLPSVDLRGDAGYSYIDSPGRRANPALGPFDGTRESATVTVSQKLWDGGARGAEYRSARLEFDASDSALRATRQEVLLAGAVAYMNVLRQTRLLELSRQNETNIMTQLDLENERVQRGSGIAVDVLQAKSRLQIAKERRVAVEGALRDAQSRYFQIYGQAADVGSMNRPRPPLSLLPETVEEAIAVAQEENPAITSGLKQVAIADERSTLAEAGYYPTFNIELSGTYENDVDGTEGVRRDFKALLKANWNIFDGFATKAAVARTAFERAATQDTQANTRRRVTEQVQLSWEALETARSRVTLLQNAVNIAEEVYAARQRLRQAGNDTALNVLDAENEVFTAKINYVSALFDAQIASYQVLAAMGRLSLETLSEAGSEAGNEARPSLLRD